MFGNLFKRKKINEPPDTTGITIFLLQNRLERFTTEQLNLAMQTAWCRPHAPGTFFATTVGDEGAIVKVNEAFYPIIHQDYRLTSEELGECTVPSWADHHAASSILAKFPGGVSDEKLPMLYGFLGLLVGQLATTSTRALFFKEAGVFVPATPEVIARLKTPAEYLPASLLD